jgi:uncharacterized protein (DUF427 family)
VQQQGHRIQVRPAGERVVVRIDGEVVADSDQAVLLTETGLPPRYYLPREHVRADVLRPSSSRSTCPFKGEASYHSVEVDGRCHDDLVWYYESPLPDVEDISGRLCFYNERVDLQVAAA